ncbi:hypothetical protein C0992_008866 [Termitomyces sp. T32_za158]|nr:hypothetical protein C0992_008866 [Termitomyces sp. T32_za158]
MSESQRDEHEPLLRPSVQLLAPEITYTLVPLEEKYIAIQRNSNYSVVFCLLLNRVHFLQDENTLTATISQSRAFLCEILAIRIFCDYGNSDMYGDSMLALGRALTTTWPVYNGADPNVLEQARMKDLVERVGNAIEMAILSKSKRFIESPSCQKIINAIWTLKVPAIRSVLEYFNFVILFILFIIAVEVNERDKLGIPETLFMIYSLGFTLEKVAAMEEHGIKGDCIDPFNGRKDLHAFTSLFQGYMGSYTPQAI